MGDCKELGSSTPNRSNESVNSERVWQQGQDLHTLKADRVWTQNEHRSHRKLRNSAVDAQYQYSIKFPYYHSNGP